MKLTDQDIASIIKSEERAALDYHGMISEKRAQNLNYYNRMPYGNEVDGQSSAITSDVADVIEWMLPSLVQTFTQGKLTAIFEANKAEHEKEAEEKTYLANYVFMQQNSGVLTLHNMFKDALLQYTGTVKVYWDEPTEVKTKKYKGLSETELAALANYASVKIEELEERQTAFGIVYDATVSETKVCGSVKYENIPPEEFLVSKTARDFKTPVFIGQRSPKRRSELIEMGFKKSVVDDLPADEEFNLTSEKNARYYDYGLKGHNPSNHHPNDIIYLGEYYAQIDVDGDGVTELWKVFYAGEEVLEREQVDDHPFAVAVPIPIPHRAIGSCPAEQVADLQYRKSILVRQMLDNIYQTNYPRVLYSNKVELDDLFTPRAGGGVGVDTDVADVAGHVQPLAIPVMIEGVMQAIEYSDVEREIRTGITRYSQGLDAESLNKTSTGFKGIMDASQQRLSLIARLFADGGVKEIFEKTIKLISEYQDTALQMKVLGKELEIDPRLWGANVNCRIDVGIGAGDRQEKIINLNNILQIQERYMAGGLVLSDQTKIYNTLEKLINEVGLKDANVYFNNPEVPEQTLFAQNQQLSAMVKQLQAVTQQNPLAEAELIKAKARMAEVSGKESASMRQFIAKMAQEDRQFAAELARDLTELELKYNHNVPGSTV